MNINILCDNETSWFWNTSNNFLEDLEKHGHKVKVCRSESELVKADVSAFISCNKIVSKEGLSKSLSNIVCHPSDLPKGRGFSPIAWEIIKDAEFLVFTLFEADEQVDNGEIYEKIKIKLNGSELNEEIKDLQAKTTYSMILDYINKFPNNKSFKQKWKPTYYKRRNKSDSELDPDKTISQQFNLLRVVDNNLYPAYFYYREKKYILKIFEDKQN